MNTGAISKDSALNLVAFGDKLEHLDLLDGVLIDLLKTKWNTFVKDKFYRQFYKFSVYFLVSLVGFTLRPLFGEMELDDDGNSTTTMMPMNDTEAPPLDEAVVSGMFRLRLVMSFVCLSC